MDHARVRTAVFWARSTLLGAHVQAHHFAVLHPMTVPRTLPKVGDVLQERYELIRVIGEGGMAVVFEGRHLRSDQHVAIKVLVPSLVRSPDIVARFDREARAVGRLRTRHVAHVLEVSMSEGGLPFIVMDLLDGRDLCSELEARGPLPVDEAVEWLLQVSAAMVEAHRAGIIHRDLKPANVFLANEGGQRVVKVLDFGISKLAGDASKLTGVGVSVGTIDYMSPEQVRATAEVDLRTDIWSLGVIAFELLTGRPPFHGPGSKIAVAIVTRDVPDVRTLAPHVPALLAGAIAKMLERDVSCRFMCFEDVIAALAPFGPRGSLGEALAGIILGGGSAAADAAKRTLRLDQGGGPRLDPFKAILSETPDKRTLRMAPQAPSAPRQARDPARHARTVVVRRPSKLPLAILGAALGALAAVGVVLIAVSVVRRDGPKPAPSATQTSAPHASTSAPSSAVTATAPQASVTVSSARPRDVRPVVSAPIKSAAPPAPSVTENPTLL